MRRPYYRTVHAPGRSAIVAVCARGHAMTIAEWAAHPRRLSTDANIRAACESWFARYYHPTWRPVHCETCTPTVHGATTGAPMGWARRLASPEWATP